MGNLALSIENLGKAYLIGAKLDTQRTLLGSARGWFTTPFRRAKSVLQGHATFIDQDVLWALKDVSFDVRHGEVVGILGANGAGKSTVLKILSRITAPTTGCVRVFGTLGALLEVGAAFHIELSARENIYQHGAIYGRSKRETDRIFDEIIEFAELGKFVDTPVKKFSSGMYSRLAFSVAAHFDTDVLIVDEVLATGDIKFVKKCLKKMENVALAGRTVLFVSHSLDAVSRLCTRAILLEKGRAVVDGNVGDVIARYLGHVPSAGDAGELGVSEGDSAGPASDAGSGAAAIAAATMADEIETTWIGDHPPEFDDRSVCLRGIRAIGAHGRPRVVFDVTEDFDVEVEYEVREAKHVLQVHLAFHDTLGRTVFVAMDNVDTPWPTTPQPSGHYVARCRVPGNLLNTGRLAIEYTVCTNPTSPSCVWVRNALTINIVEHMMPGGARGEGERAWVREWPDAIVRPRLQWSYVRTPETANVEV
jgi:lipopolysaccharide transport system ATP-binding protein